MTATAPVDATESRAGGLRVLELCDYYGPSSMGGAERVAREVNRHLSALGHEVTVGTIVAGRPFEDRGVRAVGRRPLDLSRLAGAQLAVAPAHGRWSRRVARWVRPDVLYAHSLHFHSSLAAARASRALDLPLVSVVHVGALDALSGRVRVCAELHEQLVGRYILRASDVVVAVADPVAEHCERLGARPETLVLAPNGVDHDRFPVTPEPEGPAVVLCVGRLIENKGPQLALRAVAQLQAEGIEAELVLAGDGPLRGPLEQEAARRRARVRFVGHSDDVAGLLHRAHVVVRPSYTEGMPLAVLEAMAAKRCVVASDIPPHRSLLAGGTVGVLHRAGDAGDLATQLRALLHDRSARELLAHRGHRASLRHTWADTARRHADALHLAVDRHAHRSAR